jgi:DNA-binding MarR family transcriptional regulator
MADPSSRRASLVRLTPKGPRQFRAATRAHEAWIADFFSILSQKDKKILLDFIGSQKTFVLSLIQSAVNLSKKNELLLRSARRRPLRL